MDGSRFTDTRARRKTSLELAAPPTWMRWPAGTVGLAHNVPPDLDRTARWPACPFLATTQGVLHARAPSRPEAGHRY